jgi:hypothetical protein
MGGILISLITLPHLAAVCASTCPGKS